METNIESSGLMPKVDKDGWGGALVLAFMATAGLFYVNIMPALVDSLETGLNFSSQQAGGVGSANTGGAAVGALSMVFLMQYINWRITAACLLVSMISIDLLSTGITDPDMLLVIRFSHGIFGGLLVGLSFSLITRTASPERIFGLLLGLQFGLGGLAVMFVPGTVEEFGHKATFWCLALFSFVTLLQIALLPAIPPKQAVGVISDGDRPEAKITNATGAGSLLSRFLSVPFILPLLLTLTSIILFQATNMAIGAYLIGLGSSFGLEREYISTIVALGYFIGAMGAVLVSIIGLKFGRFWPLTIAFLITLAGFLLFHWSDQQWAYAVANFVTAATWAFVIPFLFGLCSELDVSGKMAIFAGFCSKMGLTIGPLLGGYLLGTSQDYGFLINGTFFGLIISMFSILFALAVYARAQRDSADLVVPVS